MTNQEISNLIDEKFEKVRQELKAQICPKWVFSEVEKAILRNLDEEYKYIARDENGAIYVYKSAPYKKFGDNNNFYWNCKEDSDFAYFDFFPNHFQQITGDDEEPCEFRKYL